MESKKIEIEAAMENQNTYRAVRYSDSWIEGPGREFRGYVPADIGPETADLVEAIIDLECLSLLTPEGSHNWAIEELLAGEWARLEYEDCAIDITGDQVQSRLVEAHGLTDEEAWSFFD